MRRTLFIIGKVAEILFDLSASAFCIWLIMNAKDLIQFILTLTTTSE